MKKTPLLSRSMVHKSGYNKVHATGATYVIRCVRRPDTYRVNDELDCEHIGGGRRVWWNSLVLSRDFRSNPHPGHPFSKSVASVASGRISDVQRSSVPCSTSLDISMDHRHSVDPILV